MTTIAIARKIVQLAIQTVLLNRDNITGFPIGKVTGGGSTDDSSLPLPQSIDDSDEGISSIIAIVFIMYSYTYNYVCSCVYICTIIIKNLKSE